MNNFNKQRGNALTTALATVIVIGIIVIVGAILFYPYQSIDNDRNNELQTMTNEVKGTPFESPFKARINYYLADGKISNNEFNRLSDLYSGFKSSKLTGEEKNYSIKVKQDLETQYKSDEQTQVLYKYSYVIIFGIVMVLVALFGWRQAFKH